MCPGCAVACWSDNTECHPSPLTQAVKLMVGSTLTGRAALAALAKAPHCPLVARVCTAFVVGDCSIAAEIAREKGDRAVAALVTAMTSTAAAHIVVAFAADAFRTSHSAVARAFGPIKPDKSNALATHLRARLTGALAPPLVSLAPPPCPDTIAWDTLKRALSVKLRIPAKAVAPLLDPRALYALACAPGRHPVPSCTMFEAAGIPYPTAPLTRWVAALNPLERAAAHVVVHAACRVRGLSITWSAATPPARKLAICTACVEVLGVGGPGCVIDARNDEIRCGACNSAAVVEVDMRGKTIAADGRTLAACRLCGVVHRLGSGVCEACSETTPQPCICRARPKAPTAPFLCKIDGRLCVEWACDRHFALLPSTPEELADVCVRLGIRPP